MILVVFGAGASYDSVPFKRTSLRNREANREAFPNRPPLANELFLPTGLFAECLRSFPACWPIVPYLQSSDGGTIEHRLEILQAEEDKDPERKRQIAAVRYYLHFMIAECERRWSPVTAGVSNYLTLLDQLRRSRRSSDPVLLVTFNYDRLLEQALACVGMTITEIPHYVEHERLSCLRHMVLLIGQGKWRRLRSRI